MINESQVLVLKDCGGYLQVSTIPVEDSQFVLKELSDAAENPNKTLLDVQSMFLNKVPSIRSHYPYLYPYSYRSSYISGASRPKTYTYAEYNAALDKQLKGLVDGKSVKEVTLLTNEVKTNLKRNYVSECSRFIKQQMIYKAFQKAANDPSIKMYSRESIGWSSFVYKITDDIKVSVYTNFGFGYACYFTLTVSYKDIIIAPFSHVAKYYMANMTDVIRCTRDYNVDRDSWNPAFEFVRDFANKSLSNPEAFVESYIMNEITEMMHGLENIMAYPDAVIEMFRTQNASLSDYHTLRFICPMSDNEKKRFDVFPNEMPVIFKAEKLTQAVQTLERLKELGKVYPKIEEYISEIRGMVLNLTPDIQHTLKGIQSDVVKQTERKESLEKEKETLQAKADVFSKELDEQIKKLPENSSCQDKELLSSKYDTEHPDYVTLKNQIRDYEKEITKLRDNISSRSYLVSRLSACITAFSACDVEKAA